jgi:hypothetical protein
MRQILQPFLFFCAREERKEKKKKKLQRVAKLERATDFIFGFVWCGAETRKRRESCDSVEELGRVEK